MGRVHFSTVQLALLVTVLLVSTGSENCEDGNCAARSPSSLFLVTAFPQASTSAAAVSNHSTFSGRNQPTTVHRTTRISGGFSSTRCRRKNQPGGGTIGSMINRLSPASPRNGNTQRKMTVSSTDLSYDYKIVNGFRVDETLVTTDSKEAKSTDVIPDFFDGHLYLPQRPTIHTSTTGASTTKGGLHSSSSYATEHHHHHSSSLQMSSASAVLSETHMVGPVQRWSSWMAQMLSSAAPKVRPLDMAVFATYICSTVALTTPVVLLPLIAAERTGSMASAAAASSTSALVAKLAAVSTLGGAVGKFANGFVCQGLGGRNSASLYLSGMSFFMFLLSTTSTLQGLALTGIEFCSSIMWTACTVILANHYARDAKKFSAGITGLSLASTAGTLMAKFVFTALLGFMDWRNVARLSALVSLTGAGIVHGFVQDSPGGQRRLRGGSGNDRKLTLGTITDTIKTVVGNRMFWQIGLAHSLVFLARSSDKVLGSFFQDATNMPRYICGGLTASVTVGFVHGLLNGRKFNSIENPSEQHKFLTRRYAGAVIAALSLALCGNGQFASLMGGPIPLTAAMVLASGAMASSVSFQFYHLPATFAKKFGENKAVCLSFIDGMGFFVGAPIWAVVGRLVGSGLTGPHGWSLAWTMIAALFAFGGTLMMDAVPTIFDWRNWNRNTRNGG